MNQIPIAVQQNFQYTPENQKTISQKVILFLIVVLIIVISFITFVLLPYLKQKSTLRPTYLSSSCIILPEQYCSQGKLIEWTDPADQSTYLFVAFNLPSGTPLFAGATGKLDKSVEGGTPFVGRRASIIDRSVSPPVVIDVRGADMEFEGGMVPASVPAEKGQKFGKVGATGKKHAGPFAEFNTLVHLDTKDPATGKFGPAKRAYQKYFKK